MVVHANVRKIKPSLLFAVAMSAALLFPPARSLATTFWTDAMEPGSFMGSSTWILEKLIPDGNYAFDANIKHSGTHSIRLNFKPGCQASASSGEQCGGAISRAHPPTDNSYMRWWMRISGDTNQGATIGSPGGSFQAYLPATTKLVELESVHSPGSQNYARQWWLFGCCGIDQKNFLTSVERTPTPNQARNIYSSPNFAFKDNQWYCIETHSKMNDVNIVDGAAVGVPNGIVEGWVDDTRYIFADDVLFRNTGTDEGAKWMEWETIRQGGVGNIWYDDVVTADERIGCGAVIVDAIAPAAPTITAIR